MRKNDAYALFKDSLLSNRLTPGEFLTQKELSDQLGVSIGPLRDALKMLESERLVEILPQKGIRIAHVDAVFIVEAYQLRRFIEIGAVRYVAELPDREFLRPVLDQMLAINARTESMIDAGLLREALAADEEMHRILIAALDNSLISESYGRITDRIRMIRLNRGYAEARVKTALGEHLEIVKACIAGDADEAAKAMGHHLGISEARSLGKGEGIL